MKASKPLVLVDGSSYLYRAFHALPPLTNSKGKATGAVKGVISMIRKLRKDYPESPIAVVFDAKGKTFRDEIYPEYKANRPPMPDELREQIQPIHNIIQAMGLPLIAEEGVEADDVIGTLCAQAGSNKQSVVVSTGDKDMAQLVNEYVTLVNTMDNTKMDIAGVEAKFGIAPNLIIDYLALMGDSSDNIPGVPGVGQKTALALLQGLGGLNDIFRHLEKVKDLGFRGAKTLAPKLEKNRHLAELSYTLATIKLDVPLHIAAEELLPGPTDTTALMDIFVDLEFRSWVAELQEEGSAATAKPSDIEVHYDIVTDENDLNTWITRLEQAPLVAFDTETTSLDYMEAEIVGVSFSVEVGRAAYVPCAHDYAGAPRQISRSVLLEKLKPLLENPEIRKVGQNLKYDANVLANYGLVFRGIASDTMLESYVLNAATGRHDMDNLALAHLAYKTIHFEDIAGKGAKQVGINQVSIEATGKYAAEDADITLRLHQKVWPEIEAVKELRSVLEDIELPLIPVLSKIERQGALIDEERLHQQTREHVTVMAELEAQAYDLAGEKFNLASPKQLGKILFEKLHLPVIKKTPTGAVSTAEAVLQELALDYPLPKVILEYRSLAKLVSTYTEKLPLMINPRTGRVHTSYQQAVAATGRLSSTDPNLQNIPIKTEAGRRVRQAFIAPPGCKIIAADYSQIELRIMAHLSDDEGLKYAFAEGQDVHRATAAEVFGERIDQVSTEQRRSAKAINFGLIYGMSAFGLAKQLRIGRNDAQRYIDRYFARYPRVAEYMQNIRTSAAAKGYVETLYGRRLYLPEINSRNAIRRKAAERVAINAPMQGTAADIIKFAMLRVDEWLETGRVDARMIMQVHDELVLEVADADLEEVKVDLCKIMSSAVSLSVPLIVEAGIGENWDEAH